MAVKVTTSGNLVNQIKVKVNDVVENVTIGRVNVNGVTRIFFPDGDLENLTPPFITNTEIPNRPLTSGSVSGIGTTLTVSNGVWTVNNITVTPTAFVYQWKRGTTNVGFNINSYTPSILDRGQNISCTVTATYQGKEAISSSNVITVAQVPGTPSPPSLTRGTRQIGVSWIAPSNGGRPLTSYFLRYRVNGTSSWNTISFGSSTTQFQNQSYNITGLSNSTTYEVQISANNDEGAGLFSNSSIASTFGIPVNIVAPSISPTSFTAGITTLTANRGSWSSPDLIINTYRYIWAYSSSLSFTSSTIFSDQTRDPNQSSTVTTPNFPGFYIRLTVVANNAAGDSSPVNSIVYGPIALPPPSIPTNFQATGACNSITATWGQSTNANGYEILYGTSAVNIDNNIGTTAVFGGGATTNGTISISNPGNYYLKIRAYNVAGGVTQYSGYSLRIGPRTVSGVPGTPSGNTPEVACNALTFSWSLPANNGSTITSYIVRRTRSDNTSVDTTISSGTTAFTNRTITNSSLSSSFSYFYQVRAVNGCGNGAFSTSSASRTPAGIPTTTGSRPTLSGSFKSGTSISSGSGTWSNNGSTILNFNYTWQFAFNSGSSFSDLSTSTSNNRTIPSTLGGSPSGGQFIRSQVTATNGCGTSSNIYTSDPTAGVRIRCGDIGFASRGSSVSGCSSTQRRYSFSWGSSSGASNYYYEIRRTANNTIIDSGVVSGTSVTSPCANISTTVPWRFRVVGIPSSSYSSFNTANGDFTEVTGTGW
jgi:hypothetical protein